MSSPAQGHAEEILGFPRQGQGGGPAHQVGRFRQQGFQARVQRGRLGRARRTPEAAHVRAHRMHRAPAQKTDDGIARFLARGHPPGEGGCRHDFLVHDGAVARDRAYDAIVQLSQGIEKPRQLLPGKKGGSGHGLQLGEGTGGRKLSLC